jgi:endonuclease YncB( thermonuclease family)
MDNGLLSILVVALVTGLFLWHFWPKPPATSRARQGQRYSGRPPKTKARTGEEVKAAIESLPPAKVLEIYDGDTVLVATGRHRLMVRLDSIDCPEDGQHWADTAKAGLIKLIGGRTVYLEQHGHDHYGRTLATLFVRHANGTDWQNVNERMVTLGHAWVMRKYYDHLPPDRQAQLNRLETWAKSNKVGLWRTPSPIPPWQWRREVANQVSRALQAQRPTMKQ